MRPVLFRWGRSIIHSYRACLYLGLVAGPLAGRWASHRAALDPAQAQTAIRLPVDGALFLLALAAYGMGRHAGGYPGRDRPRRRCQRQPGTLDHAGPGCARRARAHLAMSAPRSSRGLLTPGRILRHPTDGSVGTKPLDTR
jgi:hypothetical protein